MARMGRLGWQATACRGAQCSLSRVWGPPPGVFTWTTVALTVDTTKLLQTQKDPSPRGCYIVCVCWGLFMFVLLYKRDLNGRCYQIFDQINLITSSKEEMKILASMFVSKVTQIWTTFGRIVGHWPRHIWVTFHTNWQQGGMAMHVDTCIYVSIDHLGMMHRFALYMWMEG